MLTKRAISSLSAVLAVALAGVAPQLPTANAQSAVSAAAAVNDTTSAAEANRVDRVNLKLAWKGCGKNAPKRARCSTATLPLDYDRPGGAQVEVALLKMPARKPGRRIGALFLNPGGPGGSGVDIAAISDRLFARPIRNRFDVIGFDPRGIARSTQVRCFRTTRAQLAAYRLRPVFPTNAEELAGQKEYSRRVAVGCSTRGKPLSASMSTAEVARDMEVLRRAVKGGKLNFLGFSYGSYLGQVYANMFPDRVRSVVIDGILDPVGWAGTPQTQETVLDDRIKSSIGTNTGFNELLQRCADAGATACPLAARGNPREQFEILAERLKAEPLVINDPDFGEFTITYPILVSDMVFWLYFTEGTEIAALEIDELLTLTDPGASPAQRGASLGQVRAIRAAAAQFSPGRYENFIEAFPAVVCTDGHHPQSFDRWITSAEAAEQQVKHFGQYWNWGTSECAREHWQAADEDAYFGPFTRTTAKPVLIVGNYYDPATPYLGAQAAASLLPNSRLLSSDSFGHTAYGTSTCTTGAVNTFLLNGRLPRAGKVCVGDYVPFSGDVATNARRLVNRLVPPIGGGRPLNR